MSCDVLFFESVQCFGFFVVDEAEGPASCAKVERMRLCQMGAPAVLAPKLSLRVSLSSIQLPRRRGLPNRPANNTRRAAKWTLGFHGIPAGSRACMKRRYEAIKRSWAAVRRRSPWDLVMSIFSDMCVRDAKQHDEKDSRWVTRHACKARGLNQLTP